MLGQIEVNRKSNKTRTRGELEGSGRGVESMSKIQTAAATNIEM